MPEPEALHRAAGGIAMVVGVSTMVSPSAFVRPFGITGLDGAGAWGWRMFGVRTALIGGLIVAGDPRARQAMVPVQLADQVTFLLAGRTPEVPTRAVRMAQGVSGVLIALSLAARRG